MCQKMDTSYTTHISVFTLNYGKMVKETSEHTCTELGVGSLDCGVLSGLDFLAAVAAWMFSGASWSVSCSSL